MNIPEIAKHVVLTAEEHTRIERARLCLLLHKTPAEIDNINWLDIQDIILVNNEDVKAAQRKT